MLVGVDTVMELAALMFVSPAAVTPLRTTSPVLATWTSAPELTLNAEVAVSIGLTRVPTDPLAASRVRLDAWRSLPLAVRPSNRFPVVVVRVSVPVVTMRAKVMLPAAVS